MNSLMSGKLALPPPHLRTRLSDRLLDFRPRIRTLAVGADSVRFLYATSQAVDWYDPLGEHLLAEFGWLQAHLAGRDERVIDAGAFHGLYSLVLAGACGAGSRVVAVDPVESNAAVMEANFALNGRPIEIVQAAVSTSDEPVRFSRESCGRIETSGGLEVPGRTLTSVLPDATVVKLDIEGAEFGVLPDQLDAMSAVHTWIVEVHPGYGHDPAIVLDLFRARAFELLRIGPRYRSGRAARPDRAMDRAGDADRAASMSPSAPLDVLCLRDHMIASGGTTYLLNTLPKFDPARVRTRLHVLAPPGPHDDARAGAGSLRTTFARRAPRDPRRVAELWRLLRASPPDLLLLSGPKSMRLGLPFARLLGVPSLLQLNYMFPVGTLDRTVQRLLSDGSHRMSAVSRAVRDWALAGFGVAAEHIDVLYAGHDLARYARPSSGARERLRGELGIADAAPVVLLSGRLLVAEKGQDVMLRALPVIARDVPDAVLVLAGDGPDRTLCTDLAERLGVSERVRFIGHRTDVPELLAMADVVAAPSTCEEAMPFVALEAHAAGRPIVVSRSGGLSELIEDGVTGLIVERGDERGLAAAIVRVLGDESLAQALARGAARDLSGFELDTHVARLTTQFETMVRDAAT